MAEINTVEGFNEPALTCPHIDAVLASGEVSVAVAAELAKIREINSQLRYGTWALKAALAAKEAELTRLRDALETISVNMHGSNPSLAYADAPREDYLAHVLWEARQLARAALTPEASNV